MFAEAAPGGRHLVRPWRYPLLSEVRFEQFGSSHVVEHEDESPGAPIALTAPESAGVGNTPRAPVLRYRPALIEFSIVRRLGQHNLEFKIVVALCPRSVAMFDHYPY